MPKKPALASKKAPVLKKVSVSKQASTSKASTSKVSVSKKASTSNIEALESNLPPVPKKTFTTKKNTEIHATDGKDLNLEEYKASAQDTLHLPSVLQYSPSQSRCSRYSLSRSRHSQSQSQHSLSHSRSRRSRSPSRTYSR